MDNLNEFFAPPVGLVPVSALGSKLYTSIILRKSYLFSMSRVGKLSQSIDKISELVNDKQIIPCFLLNPGMISRLISKMFKSDRIRSYDQLFRKEMENVFGFYSSGDNKIFILINNQQLKVNKFGFVDTDKIASITIHESAHMTSARNPSKFMNSFNPILIQYYKEYFKSIFSLESVNENLIKEIVEFLFLKFERMGNITNENIKKYHDLILKLKDGSTVDNFEKIVDKMFLAIVVFIKSTSEFIKKEHTFRNIVNPLQSTYRKIFGGSDAGNVAIQELIFPSEIIAIGSEVGNNKNIIDRIFKLL